MPEEPEGEPTPEPGRAAASLEKLKILIVDDEPGMRTAVARALTGFTVSVDEIRTIVSFDLIQAASGEEAVLKLESEKPDLMLLDHKLPGITGLDVLAWLSDRKTDILIIMMTAYASIEAAVTATKKGAFDFLSKPFTPAELRASVRKAVGHLIALRRARMLEEERRRVRFQFISVLAHELKAPLAAIEGYLYVLKDPIACADTATRDLAVDRCLIRLGGMKKLILDLLDLTRLESGQRKREVQDVDLGEVARSSIETMTPDASARGITMGLSMPDGAVVIPADRSEIEIVMNNLISNAVKYNRDGGSVGITISQRSPRVLIEVSDTGIGMSREESAKLFKEFVRIKNQKTRNILGSGLGLSIVQKIANIYGGTVEVESEPDVGSTFRVMLNPGATAVSPGTSGEVPGHELVKLEREA